MVEFFESLNTLQKVYMISSLVGGILFLLRLLLTLFGGHHDAGTVDGDIDFDVDHGGVHHGDAHDSDSSFRVLSLQGITAFFMMFGLVGLALSRQSKVAAGWSILGALTGGILAIWVIGKVFRGMSHLQSDGTMDIQNAVGQEGTVYLNIPADGEGKVQIVVQGSLRELTAVSRYKKEIKTGDRVLVDEVSGGTTLVVHKV